jgi:hypothetical protein
MKLLLPAALASPAVPVCATQDEPTLATLDAKSITLALSIPRLVRRVSPPEDLRFNPRKAVQFIALSRFSGQNRKKMRGFHDEFMADHAALLPAAVACPQAQRYAKGILDRLIGASALRQALHDADFPVHLVVTCGVLDYPDAEMRAGVLEVSAELILEMSCEDEIAAMMAHELAHYTLAHGAKTLEAYDRLTPYSYRALSISHEFEADAEGVILLANAGYDPHAAVDALKIMQAILDQRGLQSGSAHPDNDSRIRRLQEQIARADWMALPRRTRGLPAVQDELRRRPIALLRKRDDTR